MELVEAFRRRSLYRRNRPDFDSPFCRIAKIINLSAHLVTLTPAIEWETGVSVITRKQAMRILAEQA